LKNLPEDYKQDVSPELVDLMKAMTLAGLRTKSKLQITVVVAENRVQPGVVREIASVCLDMADNPNSVHIMETPEMLIKFSFRDLQSTTNPDLTFRDCLLERLARMKSRKDKKKNQLKLLRLLFWKEENMILKKKNILLLNYFFFI